MNLNKLILSGAAILLSCGVAGATTITYNSGSTPAIADITSTPTNFNGAFTVPLFDTSLGVLNSIQFTLNGGVTGQIKFESFDGSPSTITTNLAATLTLTRPDASTIVVTIPTSTFVDSATSFDGVFDYGGTSGVTHPGVSATSSNSSGVLTSSSDKTLFSSAGPGTINLSLSAAGTSNGSGSGNLVTNFSTSANAGLSVTYDYSDAPSGVPEPATMALFGSALIGLGVFRKRLGAK